jgi:hypothetical protein
MLDNSFVVVVVVVVVVDVVVKSLYFKLGDEIDKRSIVKFVRFS